MGIYCRYSVCVSLELQFKGKFQETVDQKFDLSFMLVPCYHKMVNSAEHVHFVIPPQSMQNYGTHF